MKTMFMVVTACTAALLGAPAAGADNVSFVSPSGNIACLSQISSVRCDINERTWSPPPRPGDCSDMTGYGQGIMLDATGPASFVCAGDTTFGDSEAYVLEYGRTHSLPGYQCDSAVNGVTCTNRDEHGFFLSRDGYRLF